MQSISPGASGASIISQNELDVNVKFARSFERSPQLIASTDKSWENFLPPHRQTLRSPKTGRVIPCDICGHLWVSGGCCSGCKTRRVADEKIGLEAICSILARLEFTQEGGEHHA